MKKQVRTRLQLQRTTIRVLQGALDGAAGGVTTSDNYSMQKWCSYSCMCSEPCTNSCHPCVG